MNKNKSTWIWVIGIVIVLAALFALPRLSSKPKPPGVVESNVGTDVPCLVPNVPLKQHIHPNLSIVVDGVTEEVPKDIGLGACERALHTHDTTGELHVEAQDERMYALGDFFSVWERNIEREGYTHEITVAGSLINNAASLILEDGQKIVITYIKNTTDTLQPVEGGPQQ